MRMLFLFYVPKIYSRNFLKIIYGCILNTTVMLGLN